MTWWMQPEWKRTTCANCGSTIWPEGDPDWGYCYECFSARMGPGAEDYPMPPCDICHQAEARAGVGAYGVCSEECAKEAEKRIADAQESNHE